MVNSPTMEDRRLDVVDRYRPFQRSEAKIVRLAERHAATDATSGEPHGKGLWMMVPAETSAQGSTRLHHGLAAEFAPPNNECLLQ